MYLNKVLWHRFARELFLFQENQNQTNQKNMKTTHVNVTPFKEEDYSTKSLLWTALVVGIIAFLLAPMVQGAVVITSISSAPGSLTKVVGLDGNVGDNNDVNTFEVRLTGVVTDRRNYKFGNFAGPITAQETRSFVTTTISATQTSAGVSDLAGSATSVSLGPVVNLLTTPVTTLYFWVESSFASPGNTNSMESITITQTGLGTVSLGNLAVTGGGGEKFAGIKADISGGTGNITIGWNQVFSRDVGVTSPAFGNEQTFNFQANSIPEPSVIMSVFIGSSLLILRRRR